MEHIGCLVCPHVLRMSRPIRNLIHHHDGMWQATCGEADHDLKGEDFAWVGLNHLFHRQDDLAGLELLPPDYIAEWMGDGWIVSPFNELEGEP